MSITHQQHLQMEADIEAGGFCLSALEAILASRGVSNVAELERSVYKTTPCGPYMAFKRHSGLVHVFGFGCVSNGDVRSILIGSVVEGSDAEIAAEWIDLVKYEEPEEAVAAFNQAVDWVNDRANEVADEMRGEQQ
jgi:hypothetical protein